MTSRLVAFYGYGRFGAAFGARLADAGFTVRAWDLHSSPPAAVAAVSPEELVAGADLVVLAVPVAAMRSALARLRPCLCPEHTVLDVGSVKSGPAAAMGEFLGNQIPWVGTHPLFGPTSLARGERPLRAVVCANAQHPEAAEAVRSLYSAIGCELIEQTPEEHDQFMAEGHALAYFVAKGFIDAEIDLDRPFAPPSVQAIARTVEAVQADAAHLFASLHRENPYARDARRRLLEALGKTDAALNEEPREGEVAHAELGALHIDEAPLVPAPLLEARALIDDLDDSLMELLARRADLSLRAAQAKAMEGRTIRDPARERAQLAARRQRAAELGLDEETVTQVFEAVLRFSRNHQG